MVAVKIAFFGIVFAELVHGSNGANASQRDYDSGSGSIWYHMLPSPYLPRVGLDPDIALVGGNDPLNDVVIERIPYDNVTYVKGDDGRSVLLGEGKYAEVYLARLSQYRGRDRPVVVKKILDSPQEVVFLEARLLKMVQSLSAFPHFYGLVRVELNETSGGETGWGLVQEFYGGGLTLSNYLKSRRLLSVRSWLRIAISLAESLRSVHWKRILINDIKVNNILIDTRDKFNVRFIDLGLASYNTSFVYEVSTPEGRRDRPFLSPEAHAGQFTSVASDVFSLGYVLKKIARYTQIEALRDIAASCLKTDQFQRPTVDDVINLLNFELKIINDMQLMKP